jgi:antibiotic biosynthesis monooxygenase (ABM) superfamily enzyme
VTPSGQYVEFARFKTKAGVSDAQFLEAEQQVREGMLRTTPGYISRELYKSDAGEWVVILRFTDKASMNALLDRLKVGPDDSFKRYGSLIDRESMRAEFVSLQK